MKRVIDGVIKEWGDRFSYGTVKGRKGNIGGGKAFLKPSKTAQKRPRGRLTATVSKASEVMVKITTGRKDPATGKPRPTMTNMRSIKAHFDYISRNGEVEVEDDRGEIYSGVADVREVHDNWRDEGYRIRSTGGTKREAFNIILSMPPGTDRASVKNAARAFASEMFDRHQYVFAAHEDEKHPHVHLAVKAVDRDGVRLNPRKADLQNWREIFAEKMREQGIDANATPRQIRGVVRKAEKQAVRHIDGDYHNGKRAAPSRVSKAQCHDAEQEAKGHGQRENPAHDKISATRKQVQREYGELARALAAGDADDRALAVDIVRFVQSMPPPETRHQALVRAAKGEGTARTVDHQLRPATERGPEQQQTPQDRKNGRDR